MRTHKLAILLAFALLPMLQSGEARFFRVTGPVPVSITDCSADGYVTWTNTATNATFTVQTAQTLLGPSNWVDYVQVPVTDPVTTHRLYDLNPPSGMTFIPAGSFTMGDTLDGNFNGDATPMSVMVSAFYMDRNEVSYSQWTNVYAYATNHGYGFLHAGAGKAWNHPVQTVDWYDCVKWSNARSAQGGLTPVYYTDAGLTRVYTNGEPTTLYPNWAANGYRLPTEAEWEKAARGGLSGKRFPWGDTISHSQANYQSYWPGGVPYYFYDVATYEGFNTNYNTGDWPYTSPVGSFAPNGYGLNDMAGNIWESCWDWYGTPYGQPTTNNPTGPAGPLSNRVLRGGRWVNYAGGTRCANRYYGGSDVAYNGFGFRCVRGL